MFSINWGHAINASQDGTYAQLPARRLGKAETDFLTQRIKESISPECANWIARLINQVNKNLGSSAKSTDVPTLLGLIADNRGGPDSDGDLGGVWGYLAPSSYNTAGGSFDSGIVSIGISLYKYAFNQKGEYKSQSPGDQFFLRYESYLQYSSNVSDLFILIHEVIHHAAVNGRASDEALALAATQINSEPPPDYTNVDPGPRYGRASAIWDNRLRRACGIPLNYDNKY